MQVFRPFPNQELREMGGYFSKLSWEGTGSLPKFKAGLTNLWDQHKNKRWGPTNVYFWSDNAVTAVYDLTYQTCLTQDLKHNQSFQNPTDQAMGRTTGGFGSQQRQEIFLLSKISRVAVGPTHSPIQWVQGALSPVVKLPEHKADHSPTQCQC